MANPCRICGLDPAKAKGLCQKCYAYWRRTGKDRPVKLIERELERSLEKGPQALPWWMIRRKP
jgi:hypothetical protein